MYPSLSNVSETFHVKLHVRMHEPDNHHADITSVNKFLTSNNAGNYWNKKHIFNHVMYHQ